MINVKCGHGEDYSFFTLNDEVTSSSPVSTAKNLVNRLLPVKGMETLPGKTIILIDVSGSMTWNMSAKGDLIGYFRNL